jgi:hypothetical protein
LPPKSVIPAPVLVTAELVRGKVTALSESRNINTGMPACRFCSSVNALICSHIPIRTAPYSALVISHSISNKVC